MLIVSEFSFVTFVRLCFFVYRKTIPVILMRIIAMCLFVVVSIANIFTAYMYPICPTTAVQTLRHFFYVCVYCPSIAAQKSRQVGTVKDA